MNASKEYKIKYINELTEYSTLRRMSWNQALAGKIKLAKTEIGRKNILLIY